MLFWRYIAFRWNLSLCHIRNLLTFCSKLVKWLKCLCLWDFTEGDFRHSKKPTNICFNHAIKKFNSNVRQFQNLKLTKKSFYSNLIGTKLNKSQINQRNCLIPDLEITQWSTHSYYETPSLDKANLSVNIILLTCSIFWKRY